MKASLRSLLVCCALFANSAPAAQLTLDAGGHLLGATNVEVGGALYDVSFRDGTCIELFSGCDETSDFLFPGFVLGSAAANALQSQVLVGVFDTDPWLIAGCTSLDWCIAVTPGQLGTGIGMRGVALFDRAGTGDDFVAEVVINRDSDTTSDPSTVWAVWSAVGSSAPEPSPLALVALALCACAVARMQGRNIRLNRV